MTKSLSLTHWDETADGPLSESAMRDKLASLGYAANCYVYPPETVFPPHTHAVDKIDAVLTGRFRLEMEGQSVILEAGDCLAVPRGVLHSAEVVGNDAVISLDAIKEE